MVPFHFEHMKPVQPVACNYHGILIILYMYLYTIREYELKTSIFGLKNIHFVLLLSINTVYCFCVVLCTVY